MEWQNEAEARENIKILVKDYYKQFKAIEKDFRPGDRITYAARVYDEREMSNLTDAMLDFWLTTGRFAEQFEKEFAKFLGVNYANLFHLSYWSIFNRERLYFLAGSAGCYGFSYGAEGGLGAPLCMWGVAVLCQFLWSGHTDAVGA